MTVARLVSISLINRLGLDNNMEPILTLYYVIHVYQMENARICPGFILKQDENPGLYEADGVLLLMDVQNVDFRRGKFVIESEPNSDYEIRISVSITSLVNN